MTLILHKYYQSLTEENHVRMFGSRTSLFLVSIYQTILPLLIQVRSFTRYVMTGELVSWPFVGVT